MIRLRGLRERGCVTSEQHWGSAWQSNLLRAGRIVVFWAVHSPTDWVLLHQPGFEWLKTPSDTTWDRYARVQP